VFPAWLGLLCASLTFAQTLNPAYLREMPAIERVLKDMQAGDPAETAAREMGALLQLKTMIEDAAGPRFYNRAVGLTQDETRLRQAYYTAYYQISQSKPEYRGINGPRGYDISPKFREELFRRYFSPAFRTQCLTANAASDARTRARLEADRAAAQAAMGSSGGVNPPRYPAAPQPAASAQQNAPAAGGVNPAIAAAGWVREGRAAQDRKDYSTAVADYQRAIAVDPRFADAHLHLGMAWYDQQNYQQAIEAFRKYLMLPPGKPDEAAAWLLLGSSYENLEQWTEAADAFRNLIRMNPEPGMLYKAYLELGNSLCVLRQFPAGVDALQRAIQLNPDDTDARQLLPMAQQAATRASTGSGAGAGGPRGTAQGLVRSGGAAFKSGDYAAAIADYRRAIAADPSSGDAWEGLAMTYYRQKQYKDANAAFQKCVALKPRDGMDFMLLGLTYRHLDQNAEAVDAFRAAVRLNLPDDARYEAWYNLGRSLYEGQRYADVMEPMQQAIRLKPGDADANCYIGMSYFSLQRYPEALAVLQPSIQTHPEDTSTLYWLGKTYIELKQYDKAAASLREATRLNPSDQGAWSYLAYAYFVAGQYAESIGPFQKSIELKPDDGELLLLGEAYLMLGRKAEVQDTYNKLVASRSSYAEDLAKAIRLRAAAGSAPAADTSAGDENKEVAATPAQPLSNAQIDDLVKQTGTLLAAHDWQGAIPLLEKLLAAKPNSWTFCSGMGDARFNLGQYDRALDAYQKGIRALDAADLSGADAAIKNNALAHMLSNEAMAFLRLNRNREAIAAWTREAGIDTSPVAYFNLCATQYNSGNTEGALDACDKAIAADPGKADAWFIKGALLVAGSKTGANGKVAAPPGTAEALRKYLDLAPNGPHAKDVRDMLQYIGSTVQDSRKPG